MISVCIITRNDSVRLRKCLEAIRKYPVEIVVADTGSSDDSALMAKELADKVVYFDWCDDFSAARNYVAEQATNDIILMIDTDEYITGLDAEAVENVMSKMPRSVGRIERISPYELGGEALQTKERITRLYDRRFFTYAGAIHEQVILKEGREYASFDAPVTMEHDGYIISEEEKRKKGERNEAILLNELTKRPDDTYIIYQIGKANMYKGDDAAAVEWFEKLLAVDIAPRLDWVKDMMVNYGYLLLKVGRLADAVALEGVWDEFPNLADFSFMMGNVYMQNALFEEAIAAFEKAGIQEEYSVEGTNSYLPKYNAGVIYECLGLKEKALIKYKECGKYKKAEDGIERLMRGL